jgi:hypothetical protein
MMSAPSSPVLIAVAHHSGGDHVAVGLVADQDATEVVTGYRGEGAESLAESVVLFQFSGVGLSECGTERVHITVQ